jgi:hypothetical protein
VDAFSAVFVTSQGVEDVPFLAQRASGRRSAGAEAARLFAGIAVSSAGTAA